MKKLLSVLCVLAVIAGIACIGAFADSGKATFSLVPREVEDGATLKVDLVADLEAGADVTLFGVNVTIPENLELTDCIDGGAGGMLTTSQFVTANPYLVLWINGTKSLPEGRTAVATLVFKLPADAKVGDTYAITMTFSPDGSPSSVDSTDLLVAGLASIVPTEIKYTSSVQETTPPVTTPPVTTPVVTDPPVTDPPVTTPAVTDPPVTEPPVTTPPVTEPPVTTPPVTDPPATQPPVTDPPATQPPVTDPPATQPPATEPPVTTADAVDTTDDGTAAAPVTTADDTDGTTATPVTPSEEIPTAEPGTVTPPAGQGPQTVDIAVIILIALVIVVGAVIAVKKANIK